MDLKELEDPLFDPKSWINKVTKNTEKEEEREKSVTSLIAKLQVYFHQLNTDFEQTAQNVIKNLPKVIKDTEELSEDAANLQSKMSSVQEEIEKIKRNTGLTISSLEKIDKVKMELIKYKEALHEADKWTVLSNDIKAALDVRDIDTVISKVITMQQSLNVLTKSHDYEDKKLELESFKNQLEAMASPLLLQAFTSKSVEQSKKYVHLFQGINRLPQLLKLYSQNQKSLLLQSWDIMSELESEENIVSSFQDYYGVLLKTWQEQVKWCDSVFSLPSGTNIILELYKDLWIVLNPKFSKCMENNLKQVSEPLFLLLDLKKCTQQFVHSLKTLINTSITDEEKLFTLARAIYLPYRNHISKYGVYQEAALHPHLTSLNIISGDIMESVQNLGNLNSRAFSYLDEANKLCVNLTEYCGYPGYLKAAECFLNSYLNQFRLINKEISDNQKKHEEVNMFQMCLTVLQCLGNFINKLKNLDQECLLNINKSKIEFTKAGIHPFYKYPNLLLDESKLKEFESMIKNIEKTNQLQELQSVFNYVKDLCQDVYDTTYQVIFEPIATILLSIGTTMPWDNKKGGSSSDLPDYSFVPQEYITQIGQYLMNLPQLLDPFVLSKNPELVTALTLVGSDYSGLLDNSNDENGFVEIFLGQIAKGTCKAYVKQILAIHELSPLASKQLATDINYLGNVLEDMGFSLTKKLQEIVLLLKLNPSEYSTQSSVCSPQIVAGIRQMRNIISE